MLEDESGWNYLPVFDGELVTVSVVVVVVVVDAETISSNILGASFRKYSLRFGPLISYQ